MDPKIIKLLEDIKRLFILALIKQKVQSKEIAHILDVDPAAITRITKRGLKKIKK